MISQTYSISRLICSLAAVDKKTIETCPEIQMSREEYEPKAQRPARWSGAILPGFTASGLSGTSNASGGFAEQMTVSDKIAQAIRAQSRVFQLGAQLIPAGVGGLQFPVSESGSQCQWISENFGTDAATVD